MVDNRSLLFAPTTISISALLIAFDYFGMDKEALRIQIPSFCFGPADLAVSAFSKSSVVSPFDVDLCVECMLSPQTEEAAVSRELQSMSFGGVSVLSTLSTLPPSPVSVAAALSPAAIATNAGRSKAATYSDVAKTLSF